MYFVSQLMSTFTKRGHEPLNPKINTETALRTIIAKEQEWQKSCLAMYAGADTSPEFLLLCDLLVGRHAVPIHIVDKELLQVMGSAKFEDLSSNDVRLPFPVCEFIPAPGVDIPSCPGYEFSSCSVIDFNMIMTVPRFSSMLSPWLVQQLTDNRNPAKKAYNLVVQVEVKKKGQQLPLDSLLGINSSFINFIKMPSGGVHPPIGNGVDPEPILVESSLEIASNVLKASCNLLGALCLYLQAYDNRPGVLVEASYYRMPPGTPSAVAAHLRRRTHYTLTNLIPAHTVDIRNTDGGYVHTGSTKRAHWRTWTFRALRNERYKRDAFGAVKVILVPPVRIHAEQDTIVPRKMLA